MSTTSNTLKPRYNPLLWAQLRPSTRPTASDSSQSVTSVIPLMPENKTNTSLRVVLHDTKSALEQFSDRLGKLVDGVEHAKREIDKVNNSFVEGHDKVLEELNISVNRSQKGLLETLGSPAQATVLEEVKYSQGEANRKLALLEDKAELVQRQLHAISEQQGHILTSLATITPLAPLLKDSPQQQNQILSTLTSLLPILPLLQSLPAQVKASQAETLDSVCKPIVGMGCFTASSPLFHNRTEPCAPTPLSFDSLLMDHVNRKSSRPDLEDSLQQQLPAQEDLVNTKRQPASVPLSSRTLSSEASHSSLFPALSMHSHAQQAMTISDSKSSGVLHKLPLSTDLDPGNSSVHMPPLLIPPSEREISRSRKRPRLTSNVDAQNKNMPPHRGAPGDSVISRGALSNKSLLVRSRSETTAARAFNRTHSVRPAVPIVSHGLSSTYRGPPLTSQAPDVACSPLRPTVPARLLNATPPVFVPPSPLRPKRSMATGPFPLTPDCFPPSTPPFARRGVPNKVGTPPEAVAQKPAKIPSSRNYLSCFDEYASSTSLLSGHQLRNSQQRKLLNEDADEDVEIDLDWGDVASN